ncbi:exonuclease 1 [Tribolium castaneum]|uniref:Exonuclease 1 n=1 Tax=Tribolium castaneum TaxID=7070 RepID=D7EK58_TRICA|nr:PREDICTED: exonuclease 1 [Tribolium castaneum]EFA13005.2 Exonuclease 1-like Protein [Tribolium castaneum]|eukprot:XP_967471.1 PREDICTED: exonuclease 1 [Tribolium castaneum]
MGVTQLLPFLAKSTRPCHISEFRGRTVAIDSYCWLHRGARGCAMQLAKNEDVDSYVHYCMKYIKTLLSHDIRPIMVFDGRHLPAKMKTEEKRRESKKLARKQGMECLRLGHTSDAYKFFAQSIDVTPEMALKLIRECRKLHIDCIVAPYEADAQLAYLNIKGFADCVITEDSDLLLFGCLKVMYKMDSHGQGQLVEADKIHISMKMKQACFTMEKFRYMCILSGCDYLDSLPGIGLRKALKFISMTAETNPNIFLDKLARYLKMPSLIVTDEYKQNFLVANATFLHQIVFDPIQRKLVPLTPVTTDVDYCQNAGEFFDPNTAFQLALGNLNPLTLQPIDNWTPTKGIVSDFSIWSQRFRFRSPPRRAAPAASASISTPLFKFETFDRAAIEASLAQHDQEVEKELAFYNMPPPASEQKMDVDSIESRESSSSGSPVLNKNPFMKKKLSKFQSTSASMPRVVSRFFSSSDGSENVDSSPSSVQTPESTSPVILTPDSGSPSEGISTLVECECILEVEDSVLLSVENLPNTERKRRSEDEHGGKPGKKAKRQPTIQEMFKKMQTR